MRWHFERKDEEGKSIGRFSLYGDVGVAEVSTLKEALQEGLEVSDQLFLDCSEIASLDISILQLLCSINCYSVMTNKSLKAEIPAGGELENALKEAGFKRHKACPITPGGEPCMWVTTNSG